MTVGEKIRKYRLQKNMTQEDLGNLLGVSKAAVQKYESGQVQNLKATHIKILCSLFDRTPWDFIFDEEFNVKSIPTERLSRCHHQIIVKICDLNHIGLLKIKSYLEDLLKIEEYRK